MLSGDDRQILSLASKVMNFVIDDVPDDRLDESILEFIPDEGRVCADLRAWAKRKGENYGKDWPQKLTDVPSGFIMEFLSDSLKEMSE